MNTRFAWNRWRRFARTVRAVLHESFGDAEYERYVRRCTEAGQPALDRGRYLAQRWEERYKTTSRCC